jgi:hypothetical protein
MVRKKIRNLLLHSDLEEYLRKKVDPKNYFFLGSFHLLDKPFLRISSISAFFLKCSFRSEIRTKFSNC